MRFIVDECAGAKLARWLEEAGHDVFSVYDQARGLSDVDVLTMAESEQRIVITTDKDFGEMIYRDGYSHCGVVLIRLADQRAMRKIGVMKRLLDQYGDELPGRFVVVTEGSVRIRGNENSTD